MALTRKQRVFIEEYLQVWNAAEAARRAGYSEKTARTIGSQNLAKIDIAQEIEARITEMTMSANEVLIRMAAHARADIGEFMDDFGNVNVALMKRGRKTGLIRSFRQMNRSGVSRNGDDWEEHTIDVYLHDAQNALVQLGKAHKLFVDKLDIRVENVSELPDDELEAIVAAKSGG